MSEGHLDAVDRLLPTLSAKALAETMAEYEAALAAALLVLALSAEHAVAQGTLLVLPLSTKLKVALHRRVRHLHSSHNHVEHCLVPGGRKTGDHTS